MVSDEMQLGPSGPGDIIESVIVHGDLDKLTPQERTRYYRDVCRSVGLNPLTRPFEYLRLNGKTVLYARRDATDQLRALHGVSVEEMSESERAGMWIVTCKVRNRDGRTDMATGAVPLGDLKGEALANCLMKAETKAKRRATLSICGLGMLDESEVDSIPAAAPALEAAYINEGQVEALRLLLKQLPEGDEARLCARLKIVRLEELASRQYVFAEGLLQQKIQSLKATKQ